MFAAGLANLIPGIGGILSASITKGFAQHADQRWRRFLGEFVDVVNELDSRVGELEAAALTASDEFYDATIAVAKVAAATAGESKRRMLQNALLNMALKVDGVGDASPSMQVTLLRYVEELSEDHFKLLRFFSDPAGMKGGKPVPTERMSSFDRQVITAFPEWNGNALWVRAVANDLTSRGLIGQIDVRAERGSEWTRPLLQVMGRRLMALVSGPFDSPRPLR